MHHSGIDKDCLHVQVMPSLTGFHILETGEAQSKEMEEAVLIAEFPLQSSEMYPN